MNAARFLPGARATRCRWLLITTTANTSTGGSPLSAQCFCARASAELTQSSASFSASSTVSIG